MGRFGQRPSSIKPRVDSLPLGSSDRGAKSRAAAAFVSAKGVRGAAARPLREMAFIAEITRPPRVRVRAGSRVSNPDSVPQGFYHLFQVA